MIVLETDAIVPLAHLRPILIHQILAVFLGKDELGHGDCCSKLRLARSTRVESSYGQARIQLKYLYTALVIRKRLEFNLRMIVEEEFKTDPQSIGPSARLPVSPSPRLPVCPSARPYARSHARSINLRRQ